MQTVNAATNRLNRSSSAYDSNRNSTGWSTPSGSVTASYDIDNRMTSITTPSVTETYKYGVGNLRAMKYQGGAWTYSVYGAAGELLGTFKGCSVGGVQFLCEARLRVYFGGRLILNGWTGVRPDRLGSPDGTHGRVYPYGEVSGSVSTDQDETYTTYTRDTYTGLDYAKNRSYAYSWGRFLTADPYRASGGPENPQSWNRYAYVENDPTNYMDPNGLMLAAPRGGSIGGPVPDRGPDMMAIWYSMVMLGPSPSVSSAGEEPGGGTVDNDPKAQLIRVTNLAKSGDKYFDVFNRLLDIMNVIAEDSDCAAFLQSGGQSVSGYVGGLIQGNLLAVGDLSLNSIAAFTGTLGTDVPIGAASIVVNNNSAFFNSRWNTDQGKLRGGTPQAQAFILLHELGHAMEVPGFLQDTGKPENGKKNDEMIESHCKNTLEKFQ